MLHVITLSLSTFSKMKRFLQLVTTFAKLFYILSYWMLASGCTGSQSHFRDHLKYWCFNTADCQTDPGLLSHQTANINKLWQLQLQPSNIKTLKVNFKGWFLFQTTVMALVCFPNWKITNSVKAQRSWKKSDYRMGSDNAREGGKKKQRLR